MASNSLLGAGRLAGGILFAVLFMTCAGLAAAAAEEKAPLLVGFAERDITPKVGDKRKPVYVAGFGHGRKATGVHDPLMARAIVLRHGDKKIAIVSVDLVGLFHASVVKARDKLPEFTYVSY